MMTESVTKEEFLKRISHLPKAKQVEIVKELFDRIYSGLDDKIFRLMATTVKYAKDAKTEGHENFQIEDKDLKKLAHIQDKNRLVQKK